jgi:DNA polymerase I
MKKFVIIDGNAIIHRAYHALPPLTVKDGTIVNAVYGFTSMLLKVMADLKPDYLAVSFDVAGGTFRDEVYEDYKGTREKADQDLYDQIPLCHEVVEAFNIPIYLKEGFEADDVIGTLVTKVKDENSEVQSTIVTGDMDILQLVNDTTNVFTLRKGINDTVTFDAEGVKEKYGFGPERVVDYKSLRGDTSDNIPGIKGIGDKTAKNLISKFGSLEDIYKKYKGDETLKPGVVKKLDEGKADAEMSKELATIVRDIKGLKFEIEDCVTHEFDMDEVTSLFKKFEFFSMLKRIPGYKPHESQDTQHKTDTKKNKTKKLLEITENNFKELENEIKKEKIFACREILSGTTVIDSDLLGLVFVTKYKSFYLKNPNTKQLESIFSDKDRTVVGHDLKQLIKSIINSELGTVEYKLFDIMMASYLINSSTRRHDLRSIVLRELGEEFPSGSDQTSLFGIDPKLVASELSLILQIYEKQKKELEDNEDFDLFEKVEMDLIPVLSKMELNGIAVDEKELAGLSKDVTEAIAKVTKKIFKETGEEFNIASSVQLREVLFEKLDLPTDGIKKGKTGYSTAESELDKLSGIHPIINLIREFRELEKLRNTYIDVLPKLVNKKTGRIHTTFNQAITTTGRLSSSEPNLQNIPIRTELGKKIRDAFIAESDNILIAADYSQIELRIVASLAKDKKMIEIFESGKDIHKATAAAINGVKLNDVTKEMRSAAKAVNFGVLYGMGAFGLASRTGISNFEAKEFIEKYFEEFSGVKKYIDQTLKSAHKEGYVETLFGRRRYIPELQSENFQLRNAGERMATNMPVQGTAADLMKMAMISVHKNIKALGNKNSEVRMLLQVHDEIVLEVKKGLEDEVGKLVKNVMEQVAKLNVPVEVTVDVGKSWGKLK